MNFDRWSLLSLTAAMLVHTTGVAGTKKASDAGSDRDKKIVPIYWLSLPMIWDTVIPNVMEGSCRLRHWVQANRLSN